MSGIELKGLRGLNVLESLIKENSNEQLINQARLLPIDQLIPCRFQPRSMFDSINLQNLSSSIKENGIIQPLIVRQKALEKYEIIAGERRWRAAKLAGLNEVPVVIRNISDNLVVIFALVENIQREDLNPIDQAFTLLRLVDEYSMTHARIAKIIGVSRTTVTNLLRLLALPEDVKILLIEKKLEIGHAKVILPLEKVHQIEISRKIVDNNISVRGTEKLVQKIRRISTAIKYNDSNEESEIEGWEVKLAKKLRRKVNIFLKKNGSGKIEIRFHTKDEIKWLIEHLKIE